MFLHLSVSHSVHRGKSAPVHAGIHTSWADTPPPADGYCCGWYASYWKAFLCFHRCLSVHRRGGVSVSVRGCVCPGGSLSRRVSVQVGVSVQGGSLGGLSRGRLCPGGSLSGGLCRGFSVGGSLSWRPPYGNERVVCILLECILVFIICSLEGVCGWGRGVVVVALYKIFLTQQK